ncbi:hypothetical protein OZX73_06045 [Bifidobacterium sp. ESL0775]|uniref:hypothetical protein n=1 Tax=Bifidobacterium sp. ESL0775 TaxID=2983230 RepID=UPI0023F98C2D|nr:hypothetical protein [Bifidobacterium sp. ESL0775]WEV68848.1 hypothetical protein OZX73_06045 [Bifidobacterium sp. ESL0775]
MAENNATQDFSRVVIRCENSETHRRNGKQAAPVLAEYWRDGQNRIYRPDIFNHWEDPSNPGTFKVYPFGVDRCPQCHKNNPISIEKTRLELERLWDILRYPAVLKKLDASRFSLDEEYVQGIHDDILPIFDNIERYKHDLLASDGSGLQKDLKDLDPIEKEKYEYLYDESELMEEEVEETRSGNGSFTIAIPASRFASLLSNRQYERNVFSLAIHEGYRPQLQATHE